MKAEDQATILPEPLLQFRYQQEMVSPHDGLALFGPCDADTSSRPAGITYALIATDDGTRAFAQCSRAMTQAAVVEPGKMSTRLWPPFPGFDAAFGAAWPRAAGWWHRVDAQKLADACRLADAHRRANDTVELYLEGLALAHKRDEAFGVVICIVPDDVWLYCRPESEVAEAIGPRLSSREKRQRQTGVLNLFEDYEGIWYQRSRDFRRQFKLRAMEYGLPVQIVKQSTLVLADESPTRDLTPLSDRMWNLSTTLYYKCGGKPWRLANPRPGVCYIGLSYHQTGNSESDRTACCAALMFVDDGDGIVFRGETGPWWSRKTKEFHVSKDTAAQLLAGALRTHAEMGVNR